MYKFNRLKNSTELNDMKRTIYSKLKEISENPLANLAEIGTFKIMRDLVHYLTCMCAYNMKILFSNQFLLKQTTD